jgi:hypothetical protein
MDLARRPGGRRSSGQSSGIGVMIESGEARGRAQWTRGVFRDDPQRLVPQRVRPHHPAPACKRLMTLWLGPMFILGGTRFPSLANADHRTSLANAS